MYSPEQGLSVWEAGPYIIRHGDKQNEPSDQNSKSSPTALMSPYGENNTFSAAACRPVVVEVNEKR